MGYENWIEKIINILRIRLSNYNMNTNELVYLIEYIYEDIFKNINLIKRRGVYIVDDKKLTIDISNTKTKDIQNIRLLGIYNNCTNEPIQYEYENYICCFKKELIHNCKDVYVYYSIMPKVERCDYNILLDIQSCVIEGVVDQLRQSVQNQRNQNVASESYNRYRIELENLKDKYEEYVWRTK